MALVERVAILINANASGATREFRKLNGDVKAADTNMTRLQKTTGAVGGALRRFGPAIAAGAAVGLGAFADRAIDAASALEEAEQKAQVVFGGAFGKVAEFATEQADAFNLAERAAFQYAASFGQQLKATGLAADEVAKYSLELTRLAADFASFNDISVEEAFTKLSSGLAGETEAVRRYGIDVSAAAVQAEAYASGIAEQGEKLTQTEKVQARLNIIMAETGDIQGDVARTSESLANQQRNLAQSSEDLAAALGESLAPIKADALGILSDFAGVLESVDKSFKEVGDGSTGLADVLIKGPLWRAIENVTGAWTDTEAAARDAAIAMKGNEGPVNDYGIALENAGESADTASGQITTLAGQNAYLTDKTEAAEDAIKRLTDAIDAMRNPVLDVREAERQFEQAIDDVSDALEANGTSLDINTEKGRENQAALDDIAESAFDTLRAYAENGAGADELSGKTRVLRGRLVDAAIQMGMTRDEANRYADGLGLIPGNVTTNVRLNNIDYYTQRARELAASINGIPRNVAVSVLVTEQRRDAAWASRGGRASGGPVGPGTYLVGEQGPELVRMNGTGTVMSNAKTRVAMSDAGGGDTYNITVNTADSKAAASEVVNRLKARAVLMGV